LKLFTVLHLLKHERDFVPVFNNSVGKELSSLKTDDGKSMKIMYTNPDAGVPAVGEVVDHGSHEEDHE
jgi:hypothetical protein